MQLLNTINTPSKKFNQTNVWSITLISKHVFEIVVTKNFKTSRKYSMTQK